MDPNGGTLRIALIGHKCLPATYGGVEVSAEEIGSRLASRGHQVMSFTSSPRPDGGRHRGIECHQVGRVDGKHLGALTQALTATIAACRARPDVVHFQAMGPSVFAPVVRLLTRASVVVTIAGRDDQRRKWGPMARRLMRLSYLTSTRVCHGVIAVSQHLADELTPVTRGRCVHIPNGVPAAEPTTVPLASIADDVGRRPFVLFAGRLVPEKRVDDLVRAFRSLEADVDLVVAGGPAGAKGYDTSLHDAAAGDPRIRFVGHRSKPEIDALMEHAAVFVLPSELEGLPIALLEAVGRGTPVVVSDLPCHIEVLGEGGPGARLVPVGDERRLAESIAAVVSDPDARTDASARAAEVADRYDWDQVAAQTETFYLELRSR